jgi:carboxyl-terminal processing protease
MPIRNFLTIFVALAISMASYSVATRNRYASIFGEAMDIVRREALREIPRQNLFEAAMNGMVKKLDVNSAFISQDDRSAVEDDLNQEFTGVGMHFLPDVENECLRVVAPLPGKPAWKAGIQVGDLIREIGGQTTRGLASSDAIRMIRGPVGESVTFGIERSGAAELLQIPVIRERIEIDSIYGDARKADGKWDFRLEGHPRIGYIRLMEFGRKTADEMRVALEEINDGVDSLILDLRDNPGGLLDAAVDVCDLFVGREVLIVQVRRRDNTISDRRFATSKTGFPESKPLVVLVNDRSASASEIVAACLQDHHRAVIVGQQTYGKGTVQDLISLEPNKSMLRLTTASYWRPSGKNIDRTVLELENENEYGVQPDPGFLVAQDADQQDEVRLSRNRRDTLMILKSGSNGGSPLNGGGPADPEELEKDGNFQRWLELDLPLQKAIDYLQQHSSVRVAA